MLFYAFNSSLITDHSLSPDYFLFLTICEIKYNFDISHCYYYSLVVI